MIELPAAQRDDTLDSLCHRYVGLTRIVEATAANFQAALRQSLRLRMQQHWANRDLVDQSKKNDRVV